MLSLCGKWKSHGVVRKLLVFILYALCALSCLHTVIKIYIYTSNKKHFKECRDGSAKKITETRCRDGSVQAKLIIQSLYK